MCLGCPPGELMALPPTTDFPVSFKATVNKHDLSSVGELKGTTNNEAVVIGDSQYERETLIFEKFISSSYDPTTRTFNGTMYFSFNRSNDKKFTDFSILTFKQG
jgi:hypothetical protein